MRSLPLLALLLCDLALATGVESGTVPCPGSGRPVVVYRLQSQDAHGGWDSDGARVSIRGQWRSYALSTCTDTGLTLRSKDMINGLPPNDLAKLESIDRAFTEAHPRLSEAPLWARYAHAAESYRALGRPPDELAQLYLEGSWTARDAAVPYYAALLGPIHARALLVEGAPELNKPLSADVWETVALNLISIAHRGGYLTERAALVQRALERPDLSADTRATLNAASVAISHEAHLQELAIREYTAFLNSERGTDQAQAQATFRLADLLRRTGQPDAAARLFDDAAKRRALPDPFDMLAAFLAEECRGKLTWPSARWRGVLQALAQPTQ